ncbi:HAD family phosphatase [Sinorhizobium sp. 7-81]|uniref:HAD family hydrolase n=1 Tax=Sinorhizobium sp. 8-89 TaxID=3049089 RepID=UPI0024C3831C|nr:HAD family phosphatase [Sinorhizobium sp. 8-89]MDK1489750.1 HAD family phosphatase [Sinorhizobium sp. 8-89]
MIYLPRKPSAVVFDMDGLIFDTEALYRDAVLAAALERGLDMPLPLYLSTIGLSGEATREFLGNHFGKDFNLEGFWTAATNHFHIMAETQLRLKPGVIELLDILEDAGLPWAIATSSSHQSVQHHLAAHGLLKRFNTIIASGNYTHGKPHPEPFLRAADLLGVPPELCLALEDSHNGIRAACSAGMMTIMVPDLVEPTDDIRQLCLGVATDLHEVCDIVTSGRRDTDSML